MTNISEFIHEIIAVLIFVLAVTLMLLLTNIGLDTMNAVDDDVRRKNTVTEGQDMSGGIETLTGTQVYYEIYNYAKTNDTIQIQVKPGPETSVVAVIVPNQAKEQIRQNNYSDSVVNMLTMNAEYEKVYIPDAAGNITGVRYIKQ